MSDPTNLQNLHDIIPPPPTPLLPPAPGWYVVAFVVLVVAAWFTIKRYIGWRKNTYRREAIAELNHIENAIKSEPKTSTALLKLPELLKRTALSAYGRNEVASLSGPRWLEFLNSRCTTADFSNEASQLLLAISYQSPNAIKTISKTEINLLLTNVRIWIIHHKPSVIKHQGSTSTDHRSPITDYVLQKFGYYK